MQRGRRKCLCARAWWGPSVSPPGSFKCCVPDVEPIGSASCCSGLTYDVRNISDYGEGLLWHWTRRCVGSRGSVKVSKGRSGSLISDRPGRKHSPISHEREVAESTYRLVSSRSSSPLPRCVWVSGGHWVLLMFVLKQEQRWYMVIHIMRSIMNCELENI